MGPPDETPTPVPLTPIRLARQAITEYLIARRTLATPEPLPESLARRAAAFVCLKKHGELRGCIGTTRPAFASLAEEIIQNAVSSCHRDHRFAPVAHHELQDLTIIVDVLSEPERVAGLEDLQPDYFGILVRAGHKTGVLLPNIEGVATAEVQLEIACRKAGIRSHEKMDIYRFMVERYEHEAQTEPGPSLPRHQVRAAEPRTSRD